MNEIRKINSRLFLEMLIRQCVELNFVLVCVMLFGLENFTDFFYYFR